VTRGRRIAVLAVSAVVIGGAVAALRHETDLPDRAGPGPVRIEEFTAEGVRRGADEPPRPPELVAVDALDRQSLRIDWSGEAPGYEVRWDGSVRRTTATAIEIGGLDPERVTGFEVRAVGATGLRSEPLLLGRSPGASDERWADGLDEPFDSFDGPESLDPRRWRLLADEGCFGLREVDGRRRVEVGCEHAEMQSTVPLRVGVPDEHGAVARAVLTTGVPAGPNGSVTLALLPEPYENHALGVAPPGPPGANLPPGAVALTVRPDGAWITSNGLPATTALVPAAEEAFTPPDGVRHRWELRVLADSVVALRDGRVVASAPVAVTWRVARPRLVFSGRGGALLDSFAVRGGREAPAPVSEVRFDAAEQRDGALVLGEVGGGRLRTALTARVVATVVNRSDQPLRLEFAGRTAPAVISDVNGNVGLAHADFPLDGVDTTASARAALLADDPAAVAVLTSVVVLTEGRDAPREPPPRLAELAARGETPRPLVVLFDRDDRNPPAEFPAGGEVRVVVEVGTAGHAPVPLAGVRITLDDERVLSLPTTRDGPAVAGRYELWLPTTALGRGGHRVGAEVVPEDPALPTASSERTFVIA
jgi:hypothetical protein